MSKAICLYCRFYRPMGKMDQDIPGTGNWCSNSKSEQFRTRKADDDSCDKFTQADEVAPAWIRQTNKIAARLENWLRSRKK